MLSTADHVRRPSPGDQVPHRHVQQRGDHVVHHDADDEQSRPHQREDAQPLGGLAQQVVRQLLAAAAPVARLGRGRQLGLQQLGDRSSRGLRCGANRSIRSQFSGQTLTHRRGPSMPPPDGSGPSTRRAPDGHDRKTGTLSRLADSPIARVVAYYVLLFAAAALLVQLVPGAADCSTAACSTTTREMHPRMRDVLIRPGTDLRAARPACRSPRSSPWRRRSP